MNVECTISLCAVRANEFFEIAFLHPKERQYVILLSNMASNVENKTNCLTCM